jgi:hypothetical protein
MVEAGDIAAIVGIKKRQQETPSANLANKLSLKVSTSQSRQFRLQLNQKQKQIKKKWVLRSSVLQKKTQHSVFIQTKKQDKQLSREWVNYTLKFLLIE